MKYDGRQVANFVLDRCQGLSRSVDHVQLQKLVYFCHVWNLVDNKRPLIRHSFEAWKHGPVLPYLYHEFKDIRENQISARATQIDPLTGDKKVVGYCFDPETQLLLEKTVDFYSRIRSFDLVRMSHVEGGPWHRVWNHQGNVNPGMKIDNAAIAEFYSTAKEPFSIQ